MTTTFPTMSSSATIVDAVYSYTVATNWSDLMTNGPCHTGATCNGGGALKTLLTPSSDYYWSGSNTGGAYRAVYSCSGWSTTITELGDLLDAHYTGSSTTVWLGGAAASCSNLRSLLCVCW